MHAGRQRQKVSSTSLIITNLCPICLFNHYDGCYNLFSHPLYLSLDDPLKDMAADVNVYFDEFVFIALHIADVCD